MRSKLIASLILLLVIAVPSLAESIRLTVDPLARAGSPKALATEYLKKLLEERSSGRIQVTVASGTDSSFVAALQAMDSQQIQMILPEIRNLGNRLPGLEIFELPFLYKDRQHLQRIIDGEIGTQILNETQHPKLKPLAIWDGTSRQLLAGETLISPGNIPSALFKVEHEGQTKTNHPWQEVELTDTSQQPQRNNVQALTLTNHSISSSVLLVHQGFWDQLPEDMKVIISGAVQDATLYARELADQADKKALERLKEDATISIHLLSAQQLSRWQEAMRQVYEQSTDQAKMKIVDTITKD